MPGGKQGAKRKVARDVRESACFGSRNAAYIGRMKLNLLLGCALLIISISGCKRKPSSEESSVIQPPPPKLPPSGKPAGGDAGNDLQMAQSNCAVLTLALQTYMGSHNNQAPADVNELVKAQQLRAVPQPPAGWKYSIDAKNRQVVLVKQ